MNQIKILKQIDDLISMTEQDILIGKTLDLDCEFFFEEVKKIMENYDKVLEMEKPENLGYYAIDDYIYQFILPIKQSYSPILPIAPQISSWSDVSQGQYNNFYTQTYNWNLYSPCKIPSGYLHGTLIQELKDNKQHNEFTYVS